MDEEIQEMLTKLEEDNGGKIAFRTYCRLLGYSGGTPVFLGGLLYVVNGKLIFEDFEKENVGLFGLAIGGKSKKKKYEKFKTFRMIDDITGITYVKASHAKNMVNGNVMADSLTKVSGIEKLLFPTVLQVAFASSPNWYIEILNEKEFIRYVEGS